MVEDLLDRLEAAYRAAKAHQQPVRKVRIVPRPRQEITEALLRGRSMYAHYDPLVSSLTVTALYEYAARRLLRDSVKSPQAIAADIREYQTANERWWERWREP